MRVVLYAEGPGESGGDCAWLPQPGEPMERSMLGPAHVLIARSIAHNSRIPDAAIHFVSPLRVRARPHVASDLVSVRILRRLLTFPSASRRPQLAIVLVDEDQVPRRRLDLMKATDDIDLPRVIAVPIREFEAWLIADPKALASVLGVAQTPASPEGMSRREAKGVLQTWIDNHIANQPNRGGNQAERSELVRGLRIELAKQVQMPALEALSAFHVFRDDLRSALQQLG